MNKPASLQSIVTDALMGMIAAVTNSTPPANEPPPPFIQAAIDRAVARISAAAPQPPVLGGEALPQRKSSDDYIHQGVNHIQAAAWNACHDAFMPHVTRLQAEVERLTAEKASLARAFVDKQLEVLSRGKRNAELEGLLQFIRRVIPAAGKGASWSVEMQLRIDAALNAEGGAQCPKN